MITLEEIENNIKKMPIKFVQIDTNSVCGYQCGGLL